MRYPVFQRIRTYNEERDIEACLESVRWADEIVIIGSFSTDKTLEIARRYNDKIYQSPWLGSPSIQRNITGFPFEDMEKTIKLSLEIPASRAFFSIHTLFPGTEDYTKYKDSKGKYKWGGDEEEIIKIWRRATFKFYSRPKQFFTLIKDNFFNRQQLTEFFIKFKKIMLKEDAFLK